MKGVVAGEYRITVGDGRSTEQVVAAGDYGYAHSCVSSENFPMRPSEITAREIVLLEFDEDVTSDEAIIEAARRGLARPSYEDGLYFGAQHPDVQRRRAVVFLHEPWLGYFGRLDVLCLWSNAGRRELGLVGLDDPRTRGEWLAFVRPKPPVEDR